MGNTSERLARKIERELGIKCDPCTFQRTYAGYWMRTQGAFSWIMNTTRGGTIGSMYTASELVKPYVKLDYDPREGEIFTADMFQ